MFLLWILFWYIVIGLAIYGYSVLKVWEYTKVLDFSIKNGYIATIHPYPKWLLFWLEWIVKKVRG